MGKSSPGGNGISEQHSPVLSESGHSPRSRLPKTNNNEDKIRNASSAFDPVSPSVAPGLLQVDPSFNYMRSLAGGDYKNHPSVASIFAQAFNANNISSSGKRKATTPQKIPRFHDLPPTHPLMQLPSSVYPREPPLLSSAFNFVDRERAASASPSPLPIPTMPLPFIPQSVLSTMFQQQQMRQAVAAALKVISQYFIAPLAISRCIFISFFIF